MREFTDSVDHYDTSHIGYKYSVVSVNNAVVGSIPGMTNNCIQSLGGSYVSRNFSNLNRRIVGLRYRFNAFGSYFIQIRDNNFNQVFVKAESTGSISIWNSSNGSDPNAQLCISNNGLLATNTTAYVELDTTFHSSSGSVFCYVNGILACSATNVQTTFSGNNYSNQVFLGFPISACWMDDIYVNNTLGTTNNSVEGPQTMYWITSSASGSTTQWTPNGSGSNWSCVTDTSPEPDDDTTYVSAAASGLVDIYTLQSLTGITGISCVQWVGTARTENGGAAQLAPVLYNGSTFTDTGLVVTSSYSSLLQNYGKNPITNSSWAPSDLTTLSAGQNRVV